MKIKVVVILLIVTLMVTGSIVMAQMGRRGAGRNTPMQGKMDQTCGAGFARLAKELNLTQVQITQIQQIRSDFLANTKTTREQLMAQGKVVRDLMTSDNPNPAEIETQLDQMEPLKLQLRNAGVESLVNAWNVLTPDQKAKARTLIKTKPGISHMMGWGVLSECPVGPSTGAGKGRGACINKGTSVKTK